MTYILKPHGLYAIPDSHDFLWEQISAFGPEATHGAMLLHNFVAHNYQVGKIAPPDPDYTYPDYLKEDGS